jgi:hypothetical protein
LEAIEGRVQRTNRASASSRFFNLSSDRRTISVLAEPRSRRDEKVFKLAEH